MLIDISTVGQVTEENFYAILEGFFSAAPFLRHLAFQTHLGYQVLSLISFLCPETLLFSAWALHPWGRKNMQLTSSASFFCLGCCPVSAIIVLYHSSNFIVVYSRQVSQISGTQSQPELEIKRFIFVKGVNLRDIDFFLICNH